MTRSAPRASLAGAGGWGGEAVSNARAGGGARRPTCPRAARCPAPSAASDVQRVGGRGATRKVELGAGRVLNVLCYGEQQVQVVSVFRCEERKKMSLQWAAVATFLYAEIGLILIFCLPFIPPQRWQKIFSFSVWGKIASFWNKAFLTVIVLLIVLFLDAVREVRKYSIIPAIEKSTASKPTAFEHTQMKLFRSQRNLYISGFSLFFWLVLRRLVTLITQLAKELTQKAVLKKQAENTSEAAKKFMEENERLKKILKNSGKEDETVLEEENRKLAEDQERLQMELKKTSEALSKAQTDVITMKMQSDRLSKEYDRLLKEHLDLQGHSGKGNKKGL